MSITNPYAAFEMAADLLDPKPDPYWGDPVAWCYDMIPGLQLKPYQEEILSELPKRKRISVRAPHGVGKTTTEALASLWFINTRDGRKADWKVLTTASVWRQLERYLWPEIHKWARKLDFEKLGRQRYNERTELQVMNLKLATGAASAIASDEPSAIEGAHADQMLYVIDEAKAIMAAIFDGIEGAFSSSTDEDAHIDAFALMMSTPGPPNGRFYEIQKRAPGTEDWWVRHITLDEALAVGQISQKWVDDRRRQWGENSTVFKNRVLGEFATEDEDGIIPLEWIEQAMERWHTWKKEGHRIDPLDRVGADIARTGSDKSVFALKHGAWLRELRAYNHADTMETAGLLGGILADQPQAVGRVDVIGIGAGVVDRLREQGLAVEAFNSSSRCYHTDISGELGFVNRRACAWWTMRELLDPSNGYEIALPPEDMLVGDLTAPHWKVTSASRIQVESKDEIRKRLGRSPDYGDGAVMAFAPDEFDGGMEGIAYDDTDVRIGPAT